MTFFSTPYRLTMMLTIVLVGCILLAAKGVTAQERQRRSYRWFCDLRTQPVVELEWNEQLGRYALPSSAADQLWLYDEGEGQEEVVDDDGEDHQFPVTRRYLQEEWEIEPAIIPMMAQRRRIANVTYNNNTYYNSSVPVWDRSNDTKVASMDVYENSGNSTRPTSQQVVKARLCPCFMSTGSEQGFYCPASRSHCGIPYRGWRVLPNQSIAFDEPGCLTFVRQHSIARNLWPMIVLLYAAAAFCLCSTVPGRHALACFAACFRKDFNQSTVASMIEEDAELAMRIVLQNGQQPGPLATRSEFYHFWGRRSSGNTDGNQQQNGRHRQGGENTAEELALRTRIWHSTKKVESDDDCDDGDNKINNLEDNNRNDEDDNTNKDDGSNDPGDPGVDDSVSHLSDSGRVLCSDETMCSICHAELEDGERVGALPCDHVFHVDCLKSWIQRRNVCPLCLAPQIAERRRILPSTSMAVGSTED